MQVKGLIISDTHWYSTNDIPNFLFDLVKQFDFMIHAGDWTDSEAVDLFSSLTSLFAVFGNCDMHDTRRRLSDYLSFRVNGLNIGLSHGRYRRDSIISGLNSDFNDSSLIIFGHTHVPFKEEINGKYFFNPGSFSYPRNGSKKSYGILTIDENGFSLKHVSF